MLTRSSRFSFKNKLPKNTLNFPSFNIRYEQNDERLKAAVVVSKKVDKRAVVRNRIKRLILEQVAKKIKQDNNINLVFYVKNSFSAESAEKEIDEFIAKAQFSNK